MQDQKNLKKLLIYFINYSKILLSIQKEKKKKLKNIILKIMQSIYFFVYL